MDREAALALLRELVRKHARARVPELGEDLRLRESGVDSLGLLMAMTELEEQAGIHLPDDRVAELPEMTLGACADLVTALRR